MEEHETEESIKRKIEIRDVDNVLSDPTSVTITVYSPDGNKDADAQTMTNDSAGQYSYWYTISDIPGVYKILYTLTESGLITKKRDEFRAVAEQE